MPLLLLQIFFLIVVLSGNGGPIGCLGMGFVGTYPIPKTIPNATIQCIATSTTEDPSYPSIIAAVIYSSGDIVTLTEGYTNFKMFPKISFEGSAEWTEGLKSCVLHRDSLYFASWKKCGKIPLYSDGLILSSYCGNYFTNMLVTDTLTFLWGTLNKTNYLYTTNFLDSQPTFVGNISFSATRASFTNNSYFSLFGTYIVNVYNVSGTSVTLLTTRHQLFIPGGVAFYYPYLYFIERLDSCSISILKCELMGGCSEVIIFNYLCFSVVDWVDLKVSNSKLYLYVPNDGGAVTQFNLPIPTQQISLQYSNIQKNLSSPMVVSSFGNSVFLGIDYYNNITLQLYFLANCSRDSYYDYTSNTCILCNSAPISVYIANSLCSTCAPGQYIAADTLDCTPCPPGSYGTPEYTCETCMSGTFNPYYEKTTCEKCPRGTFSHSMINTVSCTPCPKAFYSLEGSSTCFPCPAGFYGNVSGGGCIKCPFGYYSHDMAESCQECPPGYILTSVSDCKPCPKGKSTTSIEHETGKRLDYYTCFYCYENSFNNDIGQAKCTPCPKGTFSDQQYTQCTSCWKDIWGKNEYCPPSAQIIIGVSLGVFMIIIVIILGIFWRRKNWGEKIKQKWKYRNQKSFGDIKMDILDSGGKHVRLKNDFPDDDVIE